MRQSLEVWLHSGVLIGIVQEQFSMSSREFVIESERGEILYKISIPLGNALCMPKEQHFRVKIGWEDLVWLYDDNISTTDYDGGPKSPKRDNYKAVEHRPERLHNEHLLRWFVSSFAIDSAALIVNIFRSHDECKAQIMLLGSGIFTGVYVFPIENLLDTQAYYLKDEVEVEIEVQWNFIYPKVLF